MLFVLGILPTGSTRGLNHFFLKSNFFCEELLAQQLHGEIVEIPYCILRWMEFGYTEKSQKYDTTSFKNILAIITLGSP